MQNRPDVELLGPSPMRWWRSIAIWLLAAIVLAVVWHNAWRHGIGAPGTEWPSLYGLSGVILVFAAVLQFLALADGDVVLSVEGVRKGKGVRSTFIPWQGSTLVYERDKDRFVVTHKDKRITFTWYNFSAPNRYKDIMEYILYVMYEQSFRRHGQAAKIDTPIHTLSAADKAEVLKYDGDGFFTKVFRPYLSVPILLICLAYLGFVELLVYRPPLGPQGRHAANLVLHTLSVLFQRQTFPVLFPMSMMAGFFIALDLGLVALRRGRVKRLKLYWLAEFDKAQRVSLSEIGLTQQDADGPSFWVWSDVSSISETNGLILFHIAAGPPPLIIVPKHIFATPAGATEFSRQARAFRTAALMRPNIVEPISFWEIA